MNEEVRLETVHIHSRADELIACLEGEIAKRDAELAACRVAVENCELFRARIAELESQFDGESIVCGSYRDERDAALAELSAIKAQEPVEYQQLSRYENWDRVDKAVFKLGLLSSTPERFRALYAANVNQAGAPPGWKLVPAEPTVQMLRAGGNNSESGSDFMAYPPSECAAIYRDMLNAAPAAPAADAWISVSERLPGEDDQVLCWCEDETVAWAEVSSHHNSFFTDMTHELLPVTHWMPLPAAPSANSAKGVV